MYHPKKYQNKEEDVFWGDSSAANGCGYQKYISPFGWTFFTDIYAFLRKAKAAIHDIMLGEMPLPHQYYNIHDQTMKLNEQWEIETQRKKNPSILVAITKAFSSTIWRACFVCLVQYSTIIVFTYLLGRIISLQNTKNLTGTYDQNLLIGISIVIFVLAIFKPVMASIYWHYVEIIGPKMKLTIMSFLYSRLQKVTVNSLQSLNIGKVLNLLSNDINDIEWGSMFMWPLITSPIMLGIGILFIALDFQVFSLIPIGILILTNIVQTWVDGQKSKPADKKNAISDGRIKYTNELIEAIRLIKMYVWEIPLKKFIETLRLSEYKSYYKIWFIDAIGGSISDFSLYTCSYLLFLFYTLNGGILTPSKVYPLATYIYTINYWSVLFFHRGRSFWVINKLMMKRIEDLLNIPISTNNSQSIESQNIVNAISFNRYTAYWSKDKPPCLQNITTTIERGKLTAIVGKIGSGKTSFLLSFLKEIPITDGDLISPTSVAYVEQEPTIFSGTFKENILFGLQYDEERYKASIEATGLKADLDQFLNGDMTLIGERGVTLSGGQKARVSFARALYSDRIVYLLDDPLAAVDARVGRAMFDQAIRGPLLKNKFVILVTHHLNYAREADKIIVMDRGKIDIQGDAHLVEKERPSLFEYMKGPTKEKKENESDQKDIGEDINLQENAEEFENEDANTVNWQTYVQYIKSVGGLKMFITLLFIYEAYQLSVLAFVIYIGQWAENLEQFNYNQSEGQNLGQQFSNTNYYIAGAVILVGIFILSFTRNFALNSYLLKTNTKLHNRLLNRIIVAKVQFFDANPIGRILNRFSSDLGILDKSNPLTAFTLIDGTFNILTMIVTLCVITPWMAIPAILTLILLYLVKLYFTKPVLVCKKLELSTRSPLYSLLSSTIMGLLIIRTYNQAGHFLRDFMTKIYDNSRALLYNKRCNNFFGLILDSVTHILLVFGILILILVGFLSEIDSALFGLSLLFLLQIGDISSWTIRQLLYLDINMQSAQRIFDYMNNISIESQNYLKSVDDNLKNWPSHGNIEFQRVYMKYKEEANYAINGLSFTVKAGDKIGCIGRTGAGKSSIIQGLFRMVEPELRKDSFIKIDDINIQQIGLSLLRQSISILPQTPIMFTGSIRRNLDPLNHFKDENLWAAIEEVGLKSYISTLPKGLDTDITQSHSVFSTGQKQLICLARILIKRTKIVVFDEATANVDHETDEFIQQTILKKFKDCTVITIAHRLSTIANYDKVLVMDEGSAVEFDHPFNLLTIDKSDNEITNVCGQFARMVLSTGDNMAKAIFEIARENYFKKNVNH